MRKYIEVIKRSTKNTIANKREDWGNILILGIPLILAIPPISSFVLAKWYGIVIVISLFLLGWFQTNSQKVKIKDIQEELEANKYLINNNENEKNELKNRINDLSLTVELLDNNLEVLPELIVKYISFQLNLTYTDRISVYNYDFNRDMFIQVGRYSANPEFTKKGRLEYPKDKGFIKNAWQNGSYIIEELPSFEDSPGRYLEQVSQKSKLEKKIIKELSMKSSSYYCTNLVNSKHKAVGVIVIESTNSKLPYTEKELNEFLLQPFGQLLIEIIESNLMLKEGEQ